MVDCDLVYSVDCVVIYLFVVAHFIVIFLESEDYILTVFLSSSPFYLDVALHAEGGVEGYDQVTARNIKSFLCNTCGN